MIDVEYVVLFKVVCTTTFFAQILQLMEIVLQLPIAVYADNMGAIFLTINQNTSDQTKHMDVHYHSISEYVADVMVKIQFVKSSENVVDLCTKNVAGDIYEKHERKWFG